MRTNFHSTVLQDSLPTRTLSLSKWRLSTLPIEVTDLETLTELSISFNRMKTMPSQIANLAHLTRLNASDNNLVSLPPEIAALTRLTDLDVSNNPLDSGFPSHDMVARGIDALQALFRAVMSAKNTGMLEIGHLSLSTLRLEGSTLTGLKRLSLDRVSAVHLNDFKFTANEDQLTMLREISVSDAAMDFLPGSLGPLACSATALPCCDLVLPALPCPALSILPSPVCLCSAQRV